MSGSRDTVNTNDPKNSTPIAPPSNPSTEKQNEQIHSNIVAQRLIEARLAQEKYLSQLGTIKGIIANPKRKDAPLVYVIERPNGNIALVTGGLWDPNETLPDGEVGFELLVEAEKSEVPDPANSWLYYCLLEVACTLKRNRPKMRRLLKEQQYATLEVLDAHTCLPDEFVDPIKGRGCMFLGVEKEDVPKSFSFKEQEKKEEQTVNIVTAKLIDLIEWRDSQENWLGKKSLAARFAREGTYHVSSKVVKNRVNPSLSNSLQSSDSDKNIISPENESAKVVADPRWTFERLNERLEQIRDFKETTEDEKKTLELLKDKEQTLRLLNKARDKHEKTTLESNVNFLNSVITTLKTRANELRVRAQTLRTLDDPLPQLSDDELSKYEPPVTAGMIVHNFEAGKLASAMEALTRELRRILDPNAIEDEKTREIAQTIYSALATQSQLGGWQHVSEFIRNPRLYMERTKSVNPAKDKNPAQLAKEKKAFEALCKSIEALPKGPPEIHETTKSLQETGHDLIKRLIYRVDWLRSILGRENKEIPFTDLARLLDTDQQWMEDANKFMKSCEKIVAELIDKNPQRFNACRELHNKQGVQWPHSPELRKKVENTGFTFRPVMIKRDRCVCDTCGIEISGWRPWHDPRAFHDLTKHPAKDRFELYPQLKFNPTFKPYPETFPAAIMSKAQPMPASNVTTATTAATPPTTAAAASATAFTPPAASPSTAGYYSGNNRGPSRKRKTPSDDTATAAPATTAAVKPQ